MPESVTSAAAPTRRRHRLLLVAAIVVLALAALLASAGTSVASIIEKPPEQLVCEERGGTWDGEGCVFPQVDLCPDEALNPGIQNQDQLPCIVAPPMDACPDALNPGIQPVGTVCIVAPSVDACPDDALNPGLQPAGTDCIVAAPVDACPDALNPGLQPAGTTCIVVAAEVAPVVPAIVGVIGDPASIEDVAPDEVAAEEVLEQEQEQDEQEPAAQSSGAPRRAVEDLAGGGAIDTSGDLPFSGLSVGSLFHAALLALLLGAFAHADGRRLARRGR